MNPESPDPIDRYADDIIDKAQALIDQGVSIRDAYRYAIRDAVLAAELIRKSRKERSDHMWDKIRSEWGLK